MTTASQVLHVVRDCTKGGGLVLLQQARDTFGDVTPYVIADADSSGHKGSMRLFVAYGSERLTLDVLPHQNVKDIKETVRDLFGLGPDEGPSGAEMLEKKLLTLVYAGSQLKDRWLFADIGIPPGTTVKAVLKDQLKPSLYVHSLYNSEVVPIYKKLRMSATLVSEFRGIVSRQTGLPVSCFRLVATDGKEMYDCQTMDVYNLRLGDTIRMETWDGWNDFLNICIMGFASHVLSNLSANEVVARFQMKTAMYIGSHFGHVDLVVSLLRTGLRADEPIGEHPLRAWCRSQVEHVDALKAPVHEAAEAGQLSVLRSYVHNNVCNVLAKDGNGLTPLNLSLRNKQKPCASFLLTKQWSKVPYTKKQSLPLSIFVKLKRWSEQAKDKVLTIQGQWKSSVRNSRKHVATGALVGHGVQVDGFCASKMTSKPLAEVRVQEEEEARRRKPVFDFSEDDKQMFGGDMTAEQYFKSLGAMQNIKLPRLNKFGKMLNKAADREREKEKQEKEREKEREREREKEREKERERERLRTESETDDSDVFEAEAVNRPPPSVAASGATRVEGKRDNRTRSLSHDGRRVKLPPIREKSVSHSNLTATRPPVSEGESQKARSVYLATGPASSVGGTSSNTAPLFASQSSTGPGDDRTPRRKPRSRSMHSDILMAKSRTSDGSGAPPMGGDRNQKPYTRQKSETLTSSTLALYERYRGITARDYATQCLSIANSFSDKPWLQRVHQAMIIASHGVRKIVDKQPNMFQAAVEDEEEAEEDGRRSDGGRSRSVVSRVGTGRGSALTAV